MDYLQFVGLVEATTPTTSSHQSLRYWHAIYSWILVHGYADTADSPEFVAHMAGIRKTTVGTLAAHLRRMAQAGLLARHFLKRQLSEETKDDLANPILTIFRGGANALPTSFYRYCLPGAECPLEFKSADRKKGQDSSFLQNLMDSGT